MSPEPTHQRTGAYTEPLAHVRNPLQADILKNGKEKKQKQSSPEKPKV